MIDDHEMIREVFIESLARLPEISVVGEASSVEEALVSNSQPDVVLLDLNLEAGGLMREAAVAALRHRWSSSRVLILTESDSREDLLNMLSAGADGYITKHASKAQLGEAIEKVAAGEVYITPRMAVYMLQEEQQVPKDQFVLSAREKEVLKLLAEGDRDQDIATRLFISKRTVQSHLTRIRDKTGQRRRVALTRLAMERGLVKPDEEAQP